MSCYNLTAFFVGVGSKTLPNIWNYAYDSILTSSTVYILKSILASLIKFWNRIITLSEKNFKGKPLQKTIYAAAYKYFKWISDILTVTEIQWWDKFFIQKEKDRSFKGELGC